GDDALAAARLTAVIIERCSLADAILAGHEQHRAWINNGEGNDVIVLSWPNTPYTNGVASLIAQLLLMKGQTHAFFRNENWLVVSVRELGIDQAIVRLDLDCNDAASTHVGVVGKIGFFDDARARRENDVEVFV